MISTFDRIMRDPRRRAQFEKMSTTLLKKEQQMKRKNPNDLTIRNNNARKKEIKALQKKVRELTLVVRWLRKIMIKHLC